MLLLLRAARAESLLLLLLFCAEAAPAGLWDPAARELPVRPTVSTRPLLLLLPEN
jgi:hypothetical protein